MMATTQTIAPTAKPFLKWAGGKRQLLQALESKMPAHIHRYFEPFLGGGAFFFHLTNHHSFNTCILGDINPELMLTYNVVKHHPRDLIKALSKFSYSKEDFYNVRALDRDPDFKHMDDIQKAARFIYLNKTCFNGLYRVNASGYFNTPFGHYKNPLICDKDTILTASKRLATSTLKVCSFASISSQFREGDFVYLDPPYDPVSKSANFTSYAPEKFDTTMQKRLKRFCDKLTKKGANFMVSNSATPFILDLYKDYNIHVIPAKRSINSNAKKRGPVNEVIVTNY